MGRPWEGGTKTSCQQLALWEQAISEAPPACSSSQVLRCHSLLRTPELSCFPVPDPQTLAGKKMLIAVVSC
jgi:hypothetical protein